MKAIVVDPAASERLALREAARPAPAPGEALIDVQAVSLNRGEVRRARTATGPTYIPGWDLAGTVEAAAADGSGPEEGARVVGLAREGAWAHQVAVPTHALAELPEGVSSAEAATLPVAGLTALRALGKGGALLGRSVLVTGASGGVGHLACSLAREAGAQVTGLVRSKGHIDFVQSAGAHRVVASEDGAGAARHGPYDLILESVGGDVLANVLGLLATDGTCVTFGTSADPQVTLDVRSFYQAGGRALYGFILFRELKRKPASGDLARLARLVERGDLEPHIAEEVPWTEAPRVAQQLMDRAFLGKAVLHVNR